MNFLSPYLSLFTIFLYLFAAIVKAGSAIHFQQFCNLMQNICNWKSIFQCNYKKIQSSTTSIIDFKQQLPFLAGHGTRTHDLWVASPVPYPFLHEISYWNLWKFTNINTYQTFVIWYKIFAIENLFFNPDAKYLQLKIYFSIQIQKNCKLFIGI